MRNDQCAVRDGTNPCLKFSSPGSFRVATPALDEMESDPLRDVIPRRRLAPLSEILATVDQHCGMLGEFRHWQQLDVDQTPSPATAIAGIMGLGCAIAVRKTARISHGMAERELEHAVIRQFSLDNVVAGNDRVVAAMERMDLPQIHRRSREALQTSSDGRKFEVRKPSLNASHTVRHFGRLQGVSACTFIDVRSFLWHPPAFSAAGRESTCVIDGLMHDDVVRSDIHSTDEHGFMEAAFRVAHLPGISCAPGFRDLKKHKLYRFRSGSDQEAEWPITPATHVNEKAVRVSWDDLLRLVAAIRLKEATASEIFRRLNSHSRQHRLYAAMKAFGRIIKSMFVLRCIHQVGLRQAIEKQLNKVGRANGFTRAVAVVNQRGLEHSDKKDQEIAEGCNRLIRNSINCWNHLCLSRLVEAARTPEERDRILKMVALHSPMTWRYISLLGEYDLTQDRLQDNTGVLPPKSAQRIVPGNWEPQVR